MTTSTDHLPEYVKALLPPDLPRWNDPNPLGTATTVTYSFLSSIPSYYSENAKEQNKFVALDANQQAAARRALNLYSEVANISFTLETSSTGQITFGTAELSEKEGGHASYPSSDIGGDVWLNNIAASNSTQTNGSDGFLTLLHEIGHALGLKHPGPYDSGGNIPPGPYLGASTDSLQYSVMSYNDGQDGRTAYSSSSANPQTLMLYDIAAIQALYGANYNTRSEDTVYQWNQNDSTDPYSLSPSQSFALTIWDGGGNDTIDATAQILPVRINLQPGEFSSIGPKFSFNFNIPAENNVAIAYGVTIENAKGGIRDDIIDGNEANNALWGGSGNDRLNGISGSDILYGESGNDFLISVNDADQLYGGKDDDTYFVRSTDNAIVENADEGSDTVWAINTDYTLGDNLENLNLFGSGLEGRGNSLDNDIQGNGQDNYIDGWEGDDYLYGGTKDNSSDTGNDVLVAWTGSDHLYGGDGEDWLDGAADNDWLYGGEGNDILGNSVVPEEGDDHMYGEAGEDYLYGGPGQDSLYGGKGNDILTGGIGKDKFNFTAKEEGVDTITDFSVADDLIRVSKTGFGFGSELAANKAISSSQFVIGSTAANSNTRFIYNQNNGALYFDIDGKGGAGKVQFAQLSAGLTLSSNNIFMLA